MSGATTDGSRAAGELVRIGGDRINLEVLPAVGARLHRLGFDGGDLLRTPTDLARHLDDPWFWGSYPMAPWCNRIAPGRTSVAGRDLDLAVNFPDGTAIHGQVATVPWRQVDDTVFRIRAGGDGWPWPYEVEQAFAIDGARLEVRLRLTNHGDDAMPAGVGLHPWFRKPVAVAIRGRKVHPSNLATEPEPVAVEPGSALDRGRLEPMPDDLDATWTELGEPPIELAWPGPAGGSLGGVRCAITFDAPTRVVTAASPAVIDAVAVEPATHAPAGIHRLLAGEPGGLALLPPGETLQLVTQFAFDET